MDTFNPGDIAMGMYAPAGIGHNAPPEPPHIAAFQTIDDLYEEVKNFADGEPIASDEMADAITELRTRIHEAGKIADDLRKEEKKPLDDAVAEVQSRYNVYVQPKRGRVDMAKAALDDLLTPYRTAKAKAAAEEAARIALEAEEARQAANAAMQASSGNLAEREAAEEALAEAKRLEKTARRSEKAATVGTGLRTTWDVTLVDEEAAMEWIWGRAKSELLAVAVRNAEEVVRSGVRSVPGFVVVERKVAR
jgi:hypothetical protein